MNVEVKRYRKDDGYPTRYWAVYVDGELLAVVVYRKGAAAIARIPLRSSTRTLWPRDAASIAQPMPVAPPPMTMMSQTFACSALIFLRVKALFTCQKSPKRSDIGKLRPNSSRI